ncbi:MAG: poly-gamma-glutamate system protein [Longimicrobiales bacterium]|nr:poly-gamma-glutamate system protein [Longimicrobiales bacterium]
MPRRIIHDMMTAEASPRAQTLFLAAAFVSLAAWAVAERLAPPEAVPWTPQMRAAAERMGEALTASRQFRENSGLPLDAALDPNRTGLIGPEYEELFTTLGNLEAKRTTTNPDVAALLVHLLERAGVGDGDTVAVGASGSFPALLVATLTATEALGAHPVAILSLGASSYGATDPDFDLLHIHELLVERGVIRTLPAAVSLGGSGDAGKDFEPDTRERLIARVRGSGVPFVSEADRRRSVLRRMEDYGMEAGARREADRAGRPPVSAFINVGGADANIGTSPTVLSLRPGLLDAVDVPLPAEAQRGVLHEMAASGVPVIHLLDVRTLARRHGLPWDPLPLPTAGTTRLIRGDEGRQPVLLAIAGTWLAAMVVLAAAGVMIPKRSRETPTLP